MIEQSVQDIMTGTVRTVGPDATACEVATLFADRGIGSAVVLDPTTDDPLGIVTESDIMEQVAAGADTDTVRVESFLTAPLISIAPGDDIHTAAARMTEHSIRRLPVVDGGELVGILTTTDLTHYLPRLRNTILRERGELAGQ